MARRRLSDLLREEANKPSEDATAAAGGEPSAAEEPDAEALDEAEGVEETATIASNSASAKTNTAAKSRSTKQTEVADPQAAPDPKQDDALLQKIADLTSALDAQTATVKQLQAELEQAHKDARQLTDSNAKLTQELKTLQATKTAADTRALTKTESHAPQALQLAPPPPPAESENSLNSFNRDVGWFD